MKVTIIYPAGSWNNRDGRSHYRETATRLNIEVPDGLKQKDEISQLEYCFRMMNRVDGSEIEEQLNKLGERSMCVGDMVEMNGTTYICGAIGWLKFKSGMGFLPFKH